MKASFGIAIAGLIRCSFAENAKATPVQKVIELMQGMLEKGKKEKQAEEVQFAAYKIFCESTSVDKTKAIATANEEIEGLKADIEKYAADAARLKAEIAAHDEDISVWQGDIKATTKVRAIEKADFDATHKDYSESVSALERAVAVLKQQDHDRKQASLLQVSSMSMIPDEARKAIAAYMQEGESQAPSGTDVSAPEANAYEFAAGGIVDMLNKLLDKFIAERTALEKDESDSKHAFKMMHQDVSTQIEHATADRTSKADTESKKRQAKADAEGDLSDTASTRDADQKYLDDLVATCETKAADFVSRQQLRADEIVAVNKAMEIIQGGAVSGAADKHLPGLVQMKSALFGDVSLLQQRSESQSSQYANQALCRAFLEAKAQTLGSRVLTALALRVAADPFGKVKKMIKDLIVRLMEEAAEETEHKGWCDTELGTNENTRREKTEAVETLHAEVDMLTTSITKLTEDIAALSKAVAELDAAMAEATKLRTEEKGENAQTVEDAQAAQTAVSQALTVLKEFYAKAAEATAFVQQQPEAPASFDAPYKGMGGDSGGVVGMLEVIEADFGRLEADTKASEAASQKEYEKFILDSKIDHEGKSRDIVHKTSKKQDQESTLAEKKADLEGTQKELDAALDYFDKLKPSCIETGVSFEDRVQRRKEEIESLQQALRILNGEDLA
jgi:prefoldin subunit 5